ncbi:transcription factor GTE4-like isoform X2 [Phalaenopsis equestris]|uniref:transcription factor GTE4-like isoform X2 n=1 Tax=Phalaenopsis equestris TaxID=78828 RepID=UPI0009E1EB1C|nr:transcription factor GTE4-like isoform X2 [Phalaenopsis equestris]
MLGGDGSRENHRWGESKVYSRKSHNKSSDRKSGNPPPYHAADDVNSSHDPSSPPLGPLLAPSTVSEDDASSLNRPIQALINRHQSNRRHQHHRMATISLASRSREEVRDLRQKLAAELELVRAMVRKLEARELQAAAASTSLAPAAGYTMSQLSASDPNPSMLVRKTALSSEVVSCFPQVSVSVMPGESSLNEGSEKEKRTPKANQYYRNSEFLLGKERLPPLEQHGYKKHKVNGSKAIAMGEMDRSAFTNAFNSCRDLLSKLMKHKHGWVFNVPVDVKKLNIPDYHSIIKRPMDLGTVNSRLDRNWYKSPGEFAEDVRLTFKNAMSYNPKGQDVHHMAEQLLNIFEERWPSIEAQYMNVSKPSYLKKKASLDSRSLERSDSTVHPAPMETKSRVVSNVPHTGRPPPLKKPKAKDPDKRDMTFEEKQRLSNNLQNLPPEKLENIVQIIKKRNSSLSQHDDEIEVDIDSVDVETLWELDRFVTNYKKSLSKNKRKEKLAVLARTGFESNAIERMNEVIPGPEVAGEHREGKAVMGEKEVSSGSQIREEKREGHPSRSSSSSSSSSDSDSGSESSSAYGSDGGQSPRR